MCTVIIRNFLSRWADKNGQLAVAGATLVPPCARPSIAEQIWTALSDTPTRGTDLVSVKRAKTTGNTKINTTQKHTKPKTSEVEHNI